jgi:integrase/recombinase XerD
MAGAGLRVSEALALRGKDVDLDAGVIRVHRGKGGKARTVGIEAGMLAILQAWADYRRERLVMNGAEALFCVISAGRVGQPLDASSVRHMMRRRAKRAGIDGKRVHPHMLRHGFAAALAGAAPVHVVQAALGHSSLAVTSRYVAHLNPRDVVDAARTMGRLTD